MPRSKATKDDTYRPSRPRKRRFNGNQYTVKKETESTSSVTKKSKTASGASRNPINNNKSKIADDDVTISQNHGYRIIEIFTVFSALAEMLICKECKGDVTLGETENRGLGFKIVVKCSCGLRKIDSGPRVKESYEINQRIIFVMRLLGVFQEGISLFCGLMDMCHQGVSENVYNPGLKNIYTASKTVFNASCRRAVEEETEMNSKQGKSLQNLTVSGDTTWENRGFSFLVGVTTLIGQCTGKVIDLVIKRCQCNSCIFWKNETDTTEYFETDEEACDHSRSAGKTAAAMMKELFSRSEEEFGVRYGHYIGDGDSKTFKALLALQPYGEDLILIKSECVERLEKIMCKRLRNVQKLAKLGGKEKGKLSDALIKKLTKHYGLAIKGHPDSVKDMKKAVMARYYHMCSTDEEPRHEECPPGVESWCEWRVAEATGELEEFRHPPAFRDDVRENLLPIYRDMSEDDLLERCLGGYTRNCCESLKANLWRFAPKHLHCSVKTIEIAAYLATVIFNEGFYPVLKIMENMGFAVGKQCKAFADSQNEERLLKAELSISAEPGILETNKEARTARKMKKPTDEEFFDEEEYLPHGLED